MLGNTILIILGIVILAQVLLQGSERRREYTNLLKRLEELQPGPTS